MDIPGLSLMPRYISSDNVHAWTGRRMQGGGTQHRPGLLIQVSSLKGRNATSRSNFGSDIDENRPILSNILPLW